MVFAHVDFLTQCPTWNKDARQYVPYIDVNESDDYDFDKTDRVEAAEMMRETEESLYEGEVLTGRFYVDEDRQSYGAEKQAIGEMPDEPLAERYWDDDYEWGALTTSSSTSTPDAVVDRDRPSILLRFVVRSSDFSIRKVFFCRDKESV